MVQEMRILKAKSSDSNDPNKTPVKSKKNKKKEKAKKTPSRKTRKLTVKLPGRTAVKTKKLAKEETKETNKKKSKSLIKRKTNKRTGGVKKNSKLKRPTKENSDPQENKEKSKQPSKGSVTIVERPEKTRDFEDDSNDNNNLKIWENLMQQGKSLPTTQELVPRPVNPSAMPQPVVLRQTNAQQLDVKPTPGSAESAKLGKLVEYLENAFSKLHKCMDALEGKMENKKQINNFLELERKHSKSVTRGSIEIPKYTDRNHDAPVTLVDLE